MTTDERATTGPEPASLAEETAALIRAIQGWTATALSSDRVATGAAECALCPVCRLLAVLRGDRTELAERLAGGLGELARSARELVEVLRTVTGQPADRGHFETIDVGE